MYYICCFIGWTFCIYWCHRVAHQIPALQYFHRDHHKQISDDTYQGLNWKNLFLFFDTWKSTIDQWLTEVIPTIILSYFVGWWLFGLYYVWAAFIQEAIEHNPKFNLYPFITSGKWHLVHHSDNNKNFGVIFPIWDIMFGSWKAIDDKERLV
jgi:sterol desaturase/sphingolipid hydroxylase (fatty acid hydroxylase superfamily)